MNQLQTRDLIHCINTREKSIDELSKHATISASNWLNEVALQGADLIKLKAATAHGDFMTLFDASVKVSYKQAQRYMRLASNWTRVSNSDETNSLRQAIALLTQGDETQTTDEPAQRWPDFQEGISKLSRFTSFAERREIIKWPQSAKDRLWELLLPINAALRPEMFKSHTPSHD